MLLPVSHNYCHLSEKLNTFGFFKVKRTNTQRQRRIHFCSNDSKAKLEMSIKYTIRSAQIIKRQTGLVTLIQ